MNVRSNVQWSKYNNLSLCKLFCLLFIVTIVEGCANGKDSLGCDSKISVLDAESFARAIDGHSVDDISRALTACPGGLLLSVGLFKSHLDNGDCELAEEVFNGHEALWRSHFSELNSVENLFHCFSSKGKYAQAVQLYGDKQAYEVGLKSIFMRLEYAEALFGAGDTFSAIVVLNSIVGKNLSVDLNPVERASYEGALLALARMLYSVNDFGASVKAVKRYLALQPDAADGYEVLLSAIAKGGASDGIDADISFVYCEAKRIQLEDLSTVPDEVRMELEIVQEIARTRGQVIACDG